MQLVDTVFGGPYDASHNQEMIGQTIAHYRVTAKLGAGGMGEVYRAHDEQLDRDVAIKLLPPERFNDPDARARLLREARAAAALNHPHICTIHEVGDAEGQAYIAMELVDGQPLSEKVQGLGLPVDTLLRYGSQIADALAHAHEHQIIHGDLKCANVVITPEGRAKVLDFGLAKRLSETEMDEVTRSQDSLTQTGAVAGTLAYMAPEQLQGQPADARSDIWALGVVLYEIAAGARPFQGQTGFALSSAILHESPAPLPKKVPIALRAVVEHCLEKEQGRRYQHVGEVRATLEAIHTGELSPWESWRYQMRRKPWLALAGALVVLLVVLWGLNVGGLRERLFGTTQPRIRSLAVLPMTNLSGDPEKEYFADGITESLITTLGQFSELRVISRTSVMQYKKSSKPLRVIAKELKVDAVLEGSMLSADDQVQITARLIHVATDAQLWSQRYQRSLRDILALHSDVAREIGKQVRLTLTPQHEKHLEAVRPVLPDSYRAYLRGRYHWNRYEFNKALEAFREAIRLDPSYALAYVGLSDTYYGVSGLYEAPREAIPKARAAVVKALELDDSLGEAHASLANIQMSYDWNWLAAQSSFDRALERYPNYAQARIWYGTYLLYAARPEEAVQQFERAVELDPLSPTAASFAAWALYNAGRYDDAIRHAKAAMELEPGFFPAYLSLGLAYQQKGMQTDALAAYEKALSLSQGLPVPLLLRAQVLEKLGRAGEAAAILEKLKKTANDNPANIAYHIAETYCLLGNLDEAFAWLEKAYQERSEEMLIMQVDPKLQTLRGDPRYQDLLRRIGLPR